MYFPCNSEFKTVLCLPVCVRSVISVKTENSSSQQQKIYTKFKGPVKLIEWVKTALLFLHVTSKLFQFMILNLSG